MGNHVSANEYFG